MTRDVVPQLLVWPVEEGKVLWWSPLKTGLTDQKISYLEQIDIAMLRTGDHKCEISQLFPESSFEEELSRMLKDDKIQRVRLRVLDRFPVENSWPSVPFEWLRINDQPLHRKLLVERYVPSDCTEPSDPVDGLINVFYSLPKDDVKEFDSHFNRSDICETRSTSGTHYTFKNIQESTWTPGSAMVLVCHGTEKGEYPFKDPSDESKVWSLPDEMELPPLVILLVCGGNDGNLLRYAKQKLLSKKSEVKTVIVSWGKLGIEAAANFLNDFVQEWQAGKPIYEILHTSQLKATNDEYGGDHKLDTRRLCILGRGELRRSSVNELANGDLSQLTTKELTERVRQEIEDSSEFPRALAALIERVTLEKALDRKDKDFNYEETLLKRLFPISRQDLRTRLLQCLTNHDIETQFKLSFQSQSWIRGIVDKEGYLESFKKGEFNSLKGISHILPPLGTSWRKLPAFNEDELPTPLAMGWNLVNTSIDNQDVQNSIYSLKAAIGITIRFVASALVMDFIQSVPENDFKNNLIKDDLINAVFRQFREKNNKDWFAHLLEATLPNFPGRKLVRLRNVFISGLVPTELAMKLGSWSKLEFEAFADRNELLNSLENGWVLLINLLEKIHVALNEWTLRDSSEHPATWHGLNILNHNSSILPHCDDNLIDVALVKGNESVNLSPLISIQSCKHCQQGKVFFILEEKLYNLDAPTKLVYQAISADPDHRHTRNNKSIARFDSDISAGSPQQYIPTIQEDTIFLRDFEKRVKVGFLHDQLESCYSNLIKNGYIHLTGPEGCGKSWFVCGIAEASLDSDYTATLLCRLDPLNKPSPEQFLQHLADQAKNQKLSGVDEAIIDAMKYTASKADQLKLFLEGVRRQNPKRVITIILDELDEIPEPKRFSQPDLEKTRIETEHRELSILDYFSPEVDLPEGCFVLISSRPALTAHATQWLERIKHLSHFETMILDPLSPENKLLVGAYVEKNLNHQTDTLIKDIMEKSGGTFLYADHFVQALNQGAFKSDTLPEKGEFYKEYLKGIENAVRDKLYRNVYLRLLLLVAAAREGVTEKQLINWGIGKLYLRDALNNLRAFFTELSPSSSHDYPESFIVEKRYTLKHAEFLRFLKATPEMKSILEKTHREIAESCMNLLNCDVENIDSTSNEYLYAVFYLPHHLEQIKTSRPLSNTELNDYLRVIKILSESILEMEDVRSCSRLINSHIALINYIESSIQKDSANKSFISFMALIREQPNANKFDILLTYAAYRFNMVIFTQLTTQYSEESFQAFKSTLSLLTTLVNKGQPIGYLANSLSLFGLILFNRNRESDEYLEIFRTAINLHRPFINKGDPQLRTSLANTLVYFSTCLIQNNHNEEALQHYSEGIQHLKALINEGYVDKRHDLAIALYWFAQSLLNIGRQDVALANFNECIPHLETLVNEGCLALRSDLANALFWSAHLLINAGQMKIALIHYSQAFPIYMALVNEGQFDKRDKLAASLYWSARIHENLGRREDALLHFSGAIRILNTLVEENHLNERAGLAEALYWAANTLVKIGCREEALQHYNLAIPIYRTLVLEGNIAKRSHLAEALYWSAINSSKIGQAEEALKQLEEAIPIYIALVGEGLHNNQDFLADALYWSARILFDLGQWDDAKMKIQKSILIDEELISTGHQQYSEQLNQSRRFLETIEDKISGSPY